MALASPRDRTLDFLLPRAPLVRKVAAGLPERLQPGPRRTAWVLGIDGVLYLGSLEERAVGVLPLGAAVS